MAWINIIQLSVLFVLVLTSIISFFDVSKYTLEVLAKIAYGCLLVLVLSLCIEMTIVWFG